MSIVDDLDRISAPPVVEKGPRIWPWLLVVVALAAAGAVAYWLVGDSGGDVQGQPTTRTATVGYRTLDDTVAAAGRLKPSKVVEVGAQVSGQLGRLHVKVGDRVSKGDLLAEVDATIQDNLVRAGRASLEAQEAQLVAQRESVALAEADAGRQRRLMEANATTAVALEQAESALVRARSGLTAQESRLESQRASLTSEEAKLGYSRIYAPTDGTVLQLVAAEGQTLTATYVTPVILHIADLSTMTVEAKVAEANIGKLVLGMGAHFTTLGGRNRRWQGRLEQILPRAAADADVVSYTALFEVDNADGFLLADMSAQVFFEVSSPRRILAVPLSMVSDFDTDRNGEVTGQVGLLGADGRIEPRRIRIGETSHTDAEVLSGLSEGDRVAVSNR